MDTVTGKTTFTIQSVSSSKRNCACCKNKGGDIFFSINNRILLREDGVQYYAPLGGGLYGHKECLVKLFGALVDVTHFESAGNMKRLPAHLNVNILSESSFQITNKSMLSIFGEWFPKFSGKYHQISI